MMQSSGNIVATVNVNRVVKGSGQGSQAVFGTDGQSDDRLGEIHSNLSSQSPLLSEFIAR